nr:monocarboxylate transporter 9-like [Penaeus vannamei]
MEIDTESAKGDNGLMVTSRSKENYDSETSGQHDSTDIKKHRADSLDEEIDTVKNVGDMDDGRDTKDHVNTTQNHNGTLANSKSPIETNISSNKSSHLKKVAKSATPNPSIIKKPPDGGWGWLVAFGSFIITTLVFSLAVCFGILFSPFFLDLGTSSTTIAWIFNVQMFIWNFLSPFVRPAAQEFGWRRIGFTGVFFVSSSVVCSAFAPSAEFLFFSFSLLSGIGSCLAGGLCFLVVPTYFDRRRGTANAMLMSGICMGQIMGAPFIRYLQEEYAFTGAALIYGAIILNCCIGVSFFQPLKWHLKETTVTENGVPEDGSLPLLTKAENTEKNSVEEAGAKVLTQDMRTQASIVRSRMLERVSETSHVSKTSDNMSQLYVSLMEIPDLANSAETVAKDGKSSHLWELTKRVCRSTLNDLRIYHSRRALIINLGIGLCINSYINFIMMVPFMMQANGFTLQDSAWCISIFGICNLVTRLFVSPLTDWPKFNMRLCFMMGYAIISLTMFVFPLLTSLLWMGVVMGVAGCGIAANITLNNLIMIKYMGLEKLPQMFGSSALLIGCTFILFGPFIGFVRDMTESYVISTWILASTSTGSLVLWFFMPAAVAYDARMEAKRNREKEHV